MTSVVQIQASQPKADSQWAICRYFLWRIGLHREETSPATSRQSLLCDASLQLSFTFNNQIHTYYFHFLRLWTALLCIPWPYCYVSTNNLC